MKDWLQIQLEEWARWYESIDGYARSTVISRAMAGQLAGGGFDSQAPNGVEPPSGYLKKLVRKMADCNATPRKARYVTAMQLHYRFGPEQTAEILGKPSRTLRRWRFKGEDILRREMKES